MNHRRAALYLQIPAAYCRSFGGLRWAQYGEAVEFLAGPDAGRTFAFAPEIARFLEGLLAPGGSSLAFGFVLHLLYLIGLGDRGGSEGPTRCLGRIAEPFRGLGSPLRHAGALCAWLCREVPGVAEPPALDQVLGLLNGGGWIPQMVLSHPMLGSMDYAEQPGLEPSDFEQRLARAAERVSEEEIRYWLQHGRGPVESIGVRLGRARPRGLAGLPAAIEPWPRLAGVTRLVSRLEGALSLPPRRLARSELPAGGYSDVATRGTPDQVLPIQFALEDEEFLRRFAEGELLYFHREDPCRPAAEQLVLVLDQGVRTWGDVRLVLTGAAVALVRQAERRYSTIELATTGNDGERVTLAELEPAALAALLEASDLSPHPGRALALVLQAAAPGRDVVLLTHPRSLDEPEVIAAADTAPDPDGTRLFAVSVDRDGQVELAELRRGRPVRLSRSRIGLRPAAESASPRWPTARRMPWKGDVQPIPFPFRCGSLDHLRVDHSPHGPERREIPGGSLSSGAGDRAPSPPAPAGEEAGPFDFDQAGDRILVISRYGLLFTWRIDGSEAEVLPRPRVDDRLIMPLGRVIGVAGGFVLDGFRWDRQVLAHYDFASRTCTLHRVPVEGSSIAFTYIRHLHSIAGLVDRDRGLAVAFDLGAAESDARSTPRSLRAAEFVRVRAGPATGLSPGEPSLDGQTGTLSYRDEEGRARSVIARTDGHPALKSGRIVRVRQGGDVLAVQVADAVAPGLYFLSRKGATVLGRFLLGSDLIPKGFALSRDGRRFARVIGDRRLEVRDVPGDTPPLLSTAEEDVGIHFATLGRSCLLVREFEIGGPRRPRSSCLIRWDQGRLAFIHAEGDTLAEPPGGVLAESRSLSPGHPVYRHGPDPLRWVQALEHGGLRILIDRYNHLAVMDRSGRLIGMIYVVRGEAAAWMPDGTCLGSRRLIGQEAEPGAAERLAVVLRATETAPAEEEFS